MYWRPEAVVTVLPWVWAGFDGATNAIAVSSTAHKAAQDFSIDDIPSGLGAIHHRHALPRAGHPRLSSRPSMQDVDGRDNRAFTPVFDGLCPAMTSESSPTRRTNLREPWFNPRHCRVRRAVRLRPVPVSSSPCASLSL